MARAQFGMATLLILVASAFAVTDISVDELKARLDSGERLILVDVREPVEFEGGHIRGAVNFPWSSGVLRESSGTLPKGTTLVVVCQSGGRSAAASAFLETEGFDQVLDMVGGMSAWTYGTVTTDEEEESSTCVGCGGVTWGSIKAESQLPRHALR